MEDPLVESGGLIKLSEGGSLEERLAVEAEGESSYAMPGLLCTLFLTHPGLPKLFLGHLRSGLCISDARHGPLCILTVSWSSVNSYKPHRR